MEVGMSKICGTDEEIENKFKEFISNSLEKIPDWANIDNLNAPITHSKLFLAKIWYLKSGVKTTSEANKIVKIGAFASFGLFVAEYLAIVHICEEISKAENVLKDSRTEIENIKKEIIEIKSQIKRLIVIFLDFEQLEEAIKFDAAVDIKETISELFHDCEKISNRLKYIKIDIDGSIETLGIQNSRIIAGGAANVVQAAANVAQLAIMPMCSIAKVVQGLTIAGHLAIVGVYVHKYFISKERLSELQQNLEVVNAIKDDFEKVYNEVKRARRFYRENCSQYMRYKGMGERNVE